MTPRLPRRRGVVDGEVELHHPPSPVGKTPSAKFDAEALKAEYIHICRASAVGNMTKGKRMQPILDKLEANGTFNDQEAE